MAHDFWATIHQESARAAAWQQVFGTTSVPVQSPVPQWAMLPGRGRSLVYLLALDQLTAEQHDRMLAYLAATFGLSATAVARELPHGVPVLAEECQITIYHPQRWLD